MAERNFYVILGIPRDASPEDVRSAYRELAKRLHPDRAGESGTESFQELREAYETLSDPAKRRAHDFALDAEASMRRPVRIPAEAFVEDLVSLLYGEARCQPSLEAIRERFLRNDTGIGVPKGKVVEGLNVEVVLSTEEAARGAVVPIEVPTFQVCPFCDGSGRDWLFSCAYCRAEGVVEHGERVDLRIPPMVPHGSFFEIPLDRMGVHNFYLRVHIRVDDQLVA
jgi:molecular chaperone DnaJ